MGGKGLKQKSLWVCLGGFEKENKEADKMNLAF